MKLTALVKLGTSLLSVAQGIKDVFFINGKFSIERAGAIILLLALLILGANILGVDAMAEVVDMLEDVSGEIGN